MAFVAQQRGVTHRDARRAPPQHRAAARRASDPPSRAADPARATDDPAHAHGEGGSGRTAGGSARRRRTPADRRAHVPRPRPPRLLQPADGARLPDPRALLARTTTALIAVSPEVRDDLVGLGVAPASKFVVIRLGIELDERVGCRRERRRGSRRVGGSASADDAFVVGWVGRMTAVKRTDDVLRDDPEARRARHRRVCVPRRRRPGPGPARTPRARARDRTPLPLPRLPGRRRPVLRRVRRPAPTVRERGDAGERDRGTRRRPSCGRDAGRRRPGRRSATASTASSATSATSTALGGPARHARVRPRASSRDGRGRPRAGLRPLRRRTTRRRRRPPLPHAARAPA